MSRARHYPPEEVARHYRPVRHAGGWAVRVVATCELLTWEDGSVRVCETREDAEDMADGTLRVSRAMQTGFATGLLDDD
jgi:hypothetical protein